MYSLKYKNEDGWRTKDLGDDESFADLTYQTYSQVYKFVTLSKTETVTTEVVVRDSSAA